jgi:hypothetical protein
MLDNGSLHNAQAIHRHFIQMRPIPYIFSFDSERAETTVYDRPPGAEKTSGLQKPLSPFYNRSHR